MMAGAIEAETSADLGEGAQLDHTSIGVERGERWRCRPGSSVTSGRVVKSKGAAETEGERQCSFSEQNRDTMELTMGRRR